ncbi:protein lines [Eupeodes corollae]|uniref:protein lines n=1 Tax=Eupeodes corollae TaxID=290404 RepID=UPI0024923465|nr:protein lines [Eupeodes corollae]
MVLRKERPPSAGTSKSTTTMPNEQPVTKRQRIENRSNNNADNTAYPPSASNATGTSSSFSAPPSPTSTTKPNTSRNLVLDSPPDILATASELPISSPSSSNRSSSSSSTSLASEDLHHHLYSNRSNNHHHHHHHSGSTSSLASCSSSSLASTATIGIDEVDKMTTPHRNHIITGAAPSSQTMPDLVPRTNATPTIVSITNEMGEFEEYLTKQCLCGISERTLRRPFQSHYHQDSNGVKRVATLHEWPTNKLLQFLSNLQLLFDVYLKQNSKGFICSRIMDVCDALIRNDHNLIDEIIVLANFNNKYVQFLSGRVLASFLVIAKHNMDDDWLKKLVDNLFQFERLDFVAIQKIHFSLEIIKRIVEWKDVDLHPLEDEIEARNAGISSEQASMDSGGGGGPSTSGSSGSHVYPSLETNYFAVHFRDSEDILEGTTDDNRQHSTSSEERHLSHLQTEDGCHVVALTDSESFDTTHLKCITIKILENKWPALVKNMSNLISNHIELENAENCVLTFLHLWENIISVKANLSIVETLPFYAQLDKFELLLNQNLSCTIYKQMLSLFNEALCYGSTLALQDLLPEETCMLAHQIVRHVKDFRILESLPRRQPENMVSLLGFKGRLISFEAGTMQRFDSTSNHNEDAIEMDKTILQKMVLLVLKSIAVTVKEIRSDSSDSSIDSTDYDAFQDMVLIERSIRDVLRKLESFIKNTLEFHPECHFSKILIHLFDDQDDHLIEAMVCTLDVTAGISFRNNAFPELVSMLNPVYTFLEFLKMISNSSDLLLDLLVSNETCFLLYLLRFLKYIRLNWSMFVTSCHDFGMGNNTLDEAMGVLIRLRLQISRLVSRSLYPYDISPVLRLLDSCESLYEGNELS